MTAVEPLDEIDANNDVATLISTTILNFEVYEIADIQNNTKKLKELGRYPLIHYKLTLSPLLIKKGSKLSMLLRWMTV